MLFKKKQRKEVARVLRIARQEWTAEDQIISKGFFSSTTYKRVRAFCDEQLIKLMLNGHADEQYRKGWMDCQRQLDLFASVEDPENDSGEMTSMPLN